MPTDPQTAHMHTLAVRNRQVAAVHQITRLLFSKLSLDDRLRDVLSVSMHCVDAVAGSIYLYRPADDALVFEYVVGPPDSSMLIGKALPAGEGIAGRVFRSGEAVIQNSPRQTHEHRGDIGESVGFVTENVVTVPLRYLEGAPVGVMQILNKQTGGFGIDDLEVLEIVAAIAATAIENAELHRESQVAAVARAVGNLSHDIKNKVAPIALVAAMLRPDLDEMFCSLDGLAPTLNAEVRGALIAATSTVRTEYAEHCEILQEQVRTIQEHTKRISDALKGVTTEPQLELRDLDAIVSQEVRQLEPLARQHGISIKTELGGPPRCRLDQFFIASATYNLVNNAIPETPAGGLVTVRTGVREGRNGSDLPWLVLEVRDTGRGMPSHVLDRILRGDATSTKVGGTGLGTKIVYNAARAHGGVFEGVTVEGEGTTFRLLIPLRTE